MAMPFDTGNYGMYLQGYNQTMLGLVGMNGGYNTDPKANNALPGVLSGSAAQQATETPENQQAREQAKARMIYNQNRNPLACIGDYLRNYEATCGSPAIMNLNVNRAAFIAQVGGFGTGACITLDEYVPGAAVCGVAGIGPAIQSAFNALNSSTQGSAGAGIPQKGLPSTNAGIQIQTGVSGQAVSDAEAAARAKASAEAKAQADKQALEEAAKQALSPEEKAKEYLKYFTNAKNKKKTEAYLTNPETIKEFEAAKKAIEEITAQARNTQAKTPDDLSEKLKTVLRQLTIDPSKIAAFEMYYDSGNVGKLRSDMLSPETFGNDVDFKNFCSQPVNSYATTKYISPYGAAAELSFINQYDTKSTNISAYNILNFLNEKQFGSDSFFRSVLQEKDYFANTDEIIKTHVNPEGTRNIIENEQILIGKKFGERKISKYELLNLYEKLR